MCLYLKKTPRLCIIKTQPKNYINALTQEALSFLKPLGISAISCYDYNSVQFFIIYVLGQQPQGQLQT
jgi:hypothetical protein